MKPFICLICALLLLQTFCQQAQAHEIRPAYLQLTETTKGVFDIVWKVPANGDAVPAIHPVYADILTVTQIGFPEPVAGSVIYHYKGVATKSIAGSNIEIDGLQTTMIDALVKIQYMDGETVTFLLQPSNPSAMVPAKEGSLSVIKTYTKLGIEHILLGADHLLFVLALIIITSGAWTIFKTITAFTIAHSITLSLAVLGFVHVPGPPVEATIALSIVFLAVEIIHQMNGKLTITGRKPWLVAFTFGLLHGLGFASALSQVGLPQHDIPLALAFFNVGVELGQLAFIAVMLLLIKAIALKKDWPVLVRKIPAYAIGTMAAFWLIERISGF